VGLGVAAAGELLVAVHGAGADAGFGEGLSFRLPTGGKSHLGAIRDAHRLRCIQLPRQSAASSIRLLVSDREHAERFQCVLVEAPLSFSAAFKITEV
jgi:hypothetical protein